MNPGQKAGSSTKRRRPRRRPRKGDYRTKQIARYEVNKALAKRIEHKSYDTSNTAFAIDASANTSIFNLTAGIDHGPQDTQIIGSKMKPSFLRLRFQVKGADGTNMIRALVIQSKKGGGTPIASTVFQLTNSVNTPLSAFNRAYKGTFNVLYDEFFSVDLDLGPKVITGDIRIPGKKLRVMEYAEDLVDPLTTVSALWLILISDSTLANHPIGNYYSRLYYADA